MSQIDAVIVKPDTAAPPPLPPPYAPWETAPCGRRRDRSRAGWIHLGGRSATPGRANHAGGVRVRIPEREHLQKRHEQRG